MKHPAFRRGDASVSRNKSAADNVGFLQKIDVKRIEATGGFIDVFYNGEQKAHQADVRQGCYFKAGCYPQSNLSKGGSPGDYGQVEIIRLTIDHTPV